MENRLLVIATGGTIFQRATDDGVMHLGLGPRELLSSLGEELSGVCEFDIQDLHVRSGAELTWPTIFRARDAVLRQMTVYAGFLLITGTDTLEEFAFSLSLMLDCLLRRHGKTLAITGAMLPADQLGSDGAANVRDAVKVAVAGLPALSCVVVCMNNDIHLGRAVYKGDSQLIGAFRSHPGPLGQVRAGRPVLYYSPLPEQLAALATSGGHAGSFDHLIAAELRDRVPIWTLTVGAFLPEALLEAGLDGLVLAGSGTGSVPASIVDQLSPKWTSRMPIAIVSRCTTGGSPDDFYYRGSKAKYESRGFILGGPYEHLNPLQARTLLIFRLSALGHG